MELKSVILALAVLMSFSVVAAQTGLEMLEVPQGTISGVDTKIEAKLENWGYHRIFVALPLGWTPDLVETSAKSYPVREEGLWRIYGLPYDKKSLLGRGEVFTGKGIAESGFPTKLTIQIGNRYGWWLKPNEGIIIKVKVNNIGGSGTIDPQKIEKENPGIKVIRWYQQFTLKISSPGFVTAPWTVEKATLIESSPAPYSSELGKEKVYYEKYTGEPEVDIPDWDEWFTFKNSLAPIFSLTPLVSLKMEYYPEEIGEVETVLKPVWRVDKIEDIVYAYEWKRDRELEGIVFWRDQLITGSIPDWFEWF
jgi:hypothetical protein